MLRNAINISKAVYANEIFNAANFTQNAIFMVAFLENTNSCAQLSL